MQRVARQPDKIRFNKITNPYMYINLTHNNKTTNIKKGGKILTSIEKRREKLKTCVFLYFVGDVVVLEFLPCCMIFCRVEYEIK